MNRLLAACAALVLSAAAAPAAAQCAPACEDRASAAVDTAWSGDPRAPTRLIMAGPSHADGGAVWGGLEIRLAEGWFTYWRTPGEAGAPPRFDWGGSRNLGVAAVRWPAPSRETIDGREVNVYRGHIVLPIRFAPSQADAETEIALRLHYAVCGEVCRPAVAEHRIRLSARPRPAPDIAARHAALIADFLGRVPRETENLGLVARMDPNGRGLTIWLDRRGIAGAPQMFLEAPRPAVAGAPRLTAEEAGRLRFQAPLSAPEDEPPATSVTVTIVDADGVYERTVDLGGR